MAKVRSHYENLKVARDAPPEVIRAAYRTLAQKYHPDRNQGDALAARVMTIINAAYSVLSDPIKKKVHDDWIAAAEGHLSSPPNTSENADDSVRARSFTVDESKVAQAQASNSSTAYRAGHLVAHIFRNWFWYGIGAFVVVGWLNENAKPPPPGPKPYIATPTPTPTPPPPAPRPIIPSYTKPTAAPNGESWPVSAGYVPGYPRLNAKGLSTVTIDNSQNDSDVFVKLVTLDGPKAYAVRVFYIPSHSTFTLNKVTAGAYDIRSRSLDSGALTRSEQFSVQETKTETGTRFSNFTMTLYKVREGNMQTFGLAEEEF